MTTEEERVELGKRQNSWAMDLEERSDELCEEEELIAHQFLQPEREREGKAVRMGKFVYSPMNL
jgi:hypothetical protein